MTMASSSLNTESAYINCQDYGFVCRCENRVRIRTSRSVKNLNRRYMNCYNGVCRFFKWVDPPNPQGIPLPPEMDFAIERQNMNMLISEPANRTERNDDDRLKIRELQLKLKDMKTTKKKMKKELMWCRIAICILLSVLVALKLG